MSLFFTFSIAYLGLKVGTVPEAAIPVAILAVGIGYMYKRKSTILENVILQSIGAASGALVAGAIFTIPALYILGLPTDIVKIFLSTFLGGCLGILFLTPLRRYFCVEQHGKLPFPEATATTEILVSGRIRGQAGRGPDPRRRRQRRLRVPDDRRPALERAHRLPLPALHGQPGRQDQDGPQARRPVGLPRPRLRHRPALQRGHRRRRTALALRLHPGRLVPRPARPGGGLSGHRAHPPDERDPDLQHLRPQHRHRSHLHGRRPGHHQVHAGHGQVVLARLPRDLQGQEGRRGRDAEDRPRPEHEDRHPRPAGHVRGPVPLFPLDLERQAGRHRRSRLPAPVVPVHDGRRQRHRHRRDEPRLGHDPDHDHPVERPAARRGPGRGGGHGRGPAHRRGRLHGPVDLGQLRHRPQDRLLARGHAAQPGAVQVRRRPRLGPDRGRRHLHPRQGLLLPERGPGRAPGQPDGHGHQVDDVARARDLAPLRHGGLGGPGRRAGQGAAAGLRPGHVPAAAADDAASRRRLHLAPGQEIDQGQGAGRAAQQPRHAHLVRLHRRRRPHGHPPGRPQAGRTRPPHQPGHLHGPGERALGRRRPRGLVHELRPDRQPHRLHAALRVRLLGRAADEIGTTENGGEP
ncbi:MAG: OPT/YSL family transporter [Candidatus Moduliflexus flocculans]|nr:OPT/YSL family transporter [Candidatus Moduliflexus flocculans]